MGEVVKDRWEGCYAIQTKLATVAVPKKYITASRTRHVPCLPNRLCADRAGDGFQPQLPAILTAGLPFIQEHKWHGAAFAKAGLMLGGIPLWSSYVSALSRTVKTFQQCILLKACATDRARLVNFTNQPCGITFWPKFIPQRWRKKRSTQEYCFLDRSCRNPYVGIGSTILHGYGQTKGSAQVLSQHRILSNTKVFRGNGNPGLIPRTIISNQTCQSNGMSKQGQKVFCHYFDSPVIQEGSKTGKTRDRYCMKTSSSAYFSIALVQIGTPLDRTRGRRQPSMFTQQPFPLFLRVVTG